MENINYMYMDVTNAKKSSPAIQYVVTSLPTLTML